MEGRQPVTVKAGEGMVEPPNVKMTGFNKSATEPMKVVIFYVADPGTPFLDPLHHYRAFFPALPSLPLSERGALQASYPMVQHPKRLRSKRLPTKRRPRNLHELIAAGGPETLARNAAATAAATVARQEREYWLAPSKVLIRTIWISSS